MSEKQNRPTTKAVVAYAAKLRTEAMHKMAADPYARPYYPTTAAVRTLVKRIARAEAAKVKQEHPELEGAELRDAEAAARMEAPRLAIEQLALKAASTDREHREAQEAAERSLHRHQRRRAQHSRDVSAMRAGLTLGQRLDDALTGLKTVSAAPTAQLDGDRVSGGERSDRLPWAGDPHGYGRERAHKLVQRLEAILEEARSRNLEKAA